MSKTAAVTLNDQQFAEAFDSSLLVAPAKQSAVTLSPEQQAVASGSDNTSTKIRKLLGSGLKRAEVAKVLGVRYQHVRNVELTPLKKA